MREVLKRGQLRKLERDGDERRGIKKFGQDLITKTQNAIALTTYEI